MNRHRRTPRVREEQSETRRGPRNSPNGDDTYGRSLRRNEARASEAVNVVEGKVSGQDERSHRAILALNHSKVVRTEANASGSRTRKRTAVAVSRADSAAVDSPENRTDETRWRGSSAAAAVGFRRGAANATNLTTVAKIGVKWKRAEQNERRSAAVLVKGSRDTASSTGGASSANRNSVKQANRRNPSLAATTTRGANRTASEARAATCEGPADRISTASTRIRRLADRTLGGRWTNPECEKRARTNEGSNRTVAAEARKIRAIESGVGIDVQSLQ